jgi:glycosyltransferase involved in cell wall biosynthesis
MNQHISVIIPAFNEADIIGYTLKSLKSVNNIGEIIVVDDGSSDNTAKIATESGARVIRLDKNMGKGAALNRAVKLVKGSIIAFIDADLGMSAEEVKKIISIVQNKHADIAVAVFPVSEKKGGFGLVKKISSLIIKKMCGVILKEPLSGQRVFTREALNHVVPFSEGFGVEVAASIKALRKGMRLIEVPTQMKHRAGGRNIKGFIHRGKQLIDIIRAVSTEF